MILSLLAPRIWLAAAIAVALSFGGGYLKGSHDRGHTDDLERQASIAAANREAHKTEQLRQDRVDESSRVAASRESRIRADLAAARVDADGLRGDLDAVQRAAADSLTTSNQALRTTSGLLATCANRYLGVAEDAARADAEARELRDAWPR